MGRQKVELNNVPTRGRHMCWLVDAACNIGDGPFGVVWDWEGVVQDDSVPQAGFRQDSGSGFRVFF